MTPLLFAPCKAIKDSFGFQSMSVELKFWILDSLSCIPDSKAQDSVFHKPKFPGSRSPDSLTWVNVVLLVFI